MEDCRVIVLIFFFFFYRLRIRLIFPDFGEVLEVSSVIVHSFKPQVFIGERVG